MTLPPDGPRRSADLLAAGPSGPPGRRRPGGPGSAGRWDRGVARLRGGSASVRRRRAVATVVVLGAVAVGAALWSTAGTRPGPRPTLVVVAEVPPAPAPPYDRLPGRTAIPVPAQTQNQVSGLLPEVGTPSRVAAGRAADLVLGRYCADPRRYTYTLQPDARAAGDGWGDVRVLVFGLDSSGAGPVQDLALRWTGRQYRWIGSLGLLRGC